MFLPVSYLLAVGESTSGAGRGWAGWCEQQVRLPAPLGPIKTDGGRPDLHAERRAGDGSQ